MKTTVVQVTELDEAARLDAAYFVAIHDSKLTRLQVVSRRWERLGDLLGNDNVWAPTRLTQVHAQDTRYGKPYIAPWDTLRYLPRPNFLLSRSQTRNFSQYELSRGWLLVTCSGRNLGPAMFVDDILSRFALSHDIVRVSAPGHPELFYVLAFLNTPTGQQLVRRNKAGSVIDHIDVSDVRETPIPILPDDVRLLASERFHTATLLREKARVTLLLAEDEYLQTVGIEETGQRYSAGTYPRWFSVSANNLNARMDAEPHAPQYEACRSAFLASGCARSIGEMAQLSRPPGRYRTIYINDPRFGLPLLSGRQIAQFRPVGLRLISALSFRDPDEYKLQSGMVVMAADGRAEENLGDCAVIMEDRAGWAASGHVIRLTPKDGVHIGMLYLACTNSLVQAQIKALATGSVVDGLSEMDLESVIAGYPSDEVVAKRLGKTVMDAWSMFSSATAQENEAIAVLEDHFIRS